MARMTQGFSNATHFAPPGWWFNKAELEALNKITTEMSSDKRAWTLVDQSNEFFADTVAITGGYRDISIRKFKSPDRSGFSYDVFRDGKFVTMKTFNEVQVEVQRFILNCKRLDLVFDRITACLDLEAVQPR